MAVLILRILFLTVFIALFGGLIKINLISTERNRMDYSLERYALSVAKNAPVSVAENELNEYLGETVNVIAENEGNNITKYTISRNTTYSEITSTIKIHKLNEKITIIR